MILYMDTPEGYVKEGGGKINACPPNILKLYQKSLRIGIYVLRSMQLNTEQAGLKIEPADFLSFTYEVYSYVL